MRETNTQYFALIPGSFKPPHKGHYALIEHYSNLIGDKGTVNVFISNPKPKSQRKASNGLIIEASLSKQILEIYCKNLKNVNFYISEISPVKDCYDFGEKITKGALIFGCSTKNEDLKRFDLIEKYYSTHFPSIKIEKPSNNALEPLFESLSSTDFRASFGNREKMKEFLPSHLSQSDKDTILQLLE